ncbi:MAG: hypothetical protein AB1938_17630 [Myxococcota bacterium]
MKWSRLVLALSLVAQAALAQSAGPVCEVARPLDGQRLLRRLSLDLRHVVPSRVEQEAQRGHEDVSEATIDAMLSSDGFRKVVRAYHADLLWPNLDAVEIDPNYFDLIETEIAPGVKVWWSPVRSLYYRTITKVFVPCSAQPASYDTSGYLVTAPLIEGGMPVARQEGWVEVEPYWAPGTRVKVCGYDAQTAAQAPICPTGGGAYVTQTCNQFRGYAQAVGFDPTGQPAACDSAFGLLAPGCGCGPNLRFCSTDATAKAVRASMLEQQLRLIDRIVTTGRPYTDVLLAKDVEVNGPLAHYLTFQSTTSFDIFGEKDVTAPVPAGLSYTSPGWVPQPRAGRHSGVLTTAGYLLKFQSNRARAHRFYSAFECSQFVPNGPLPSPSEPCSKREDLTQRCGCNACHVKLEPMAAHWGRFAEYGHTPLDEARYPKTYGTVCAGITNLDQLFRCFRFYQLEAVGDELPFKGLLKPYVFRTPEEEAGLEAGPTHLVQESIDSGRFAQCTTRRVWTRFMHREPTAAEELEVLPGLAQDFEANGFDFKRLVKAVVMNPAYRRMP